MLKRPYWSLPEAPFSQSWLSDFSSFSYFALPACIRIFFFNETYFLLNRSYWSPFPLLTWLPDFSSFPFSASLTFLELCSTLFDRNCTFVHFISFFVGPIWNNPLSVILCYNTAFHLVFIITLAEGIKDILQFCIYIFLFIYVCFELMCDILNLLSP